jgi:hypothetical protein
LWLGVAGFEVVNVAPAMTTHQHASTISIPLAPARVVVYDALVAADVSSSTDFDASVFQEDVIALLALVQKEAKVEQFAWRLVEPVNRPMWPWLQFVLGRVVAVNQPMAPWLRLLLSRVVMLFGGLAAAVV